jgi:L-fuculose-phosphate aldolase
VKAIVTPSAQDAIREKGLVVKQDCGGGSSGVVAGPGTDWDKLLRSPEAEAIKAEICAVGRKVWQRGYVDGNGGNISCRLTADAVICTPTLVSKADLKPEDLCLVDLAGNQLAGGRPRTSEILLHLEIYKAVPEAKGIVHCHPVHATAYAITGRVPPNCIIPEFEVFVGKLALSPYETPGTQVFAETVLPWVKSHNTVLLANHGIVCWADSVTKAEWFVEVVDTYCHTLMVASQLGPITHIPGDKAVDLIEIKQRMGLPDPRLGSDGAICVCPTEPGGITALPPDPVSSADDTAALIKAVTDAVMARLK